MVSFPLVGVGLPGELPVSSPSSPGAALALLFGNAMARRWLWWLCAAEIGGVDCSEIGVITALERLPLSMWDGLSRLGVDEIPIRR